MQTVIGTISGLIAARDNAVKLNKTGLDHVSKLRDIERDFLPSGSGFDSGTRIDVESSTPTKIIMHTSFHHMNDNGFYDGWTDHKIVVRPTFVSLIVDIWVGGQNKRGIKDYIAETFDIALGQKIQYDCDKQKYVRWDTPDSIF